FMGQEILEDKLWDDNEKDHPGHLIWWDGLNHGPVMANYLRFMQDLVGLRRNQPALRAEGVRVSRVNNYDRVIVVHRWVADGSADQDVLLVPIWTSMPRLATASGWRSAAAGANFSTAIITTAFPIRRRSETAVRSMRPARVSMASRIPP